MPDVASTRAERRALAARAASASPQAPAEDAPPTSRRDHRRAERLRRQRLVRLRRTVIASLGLLLIGTGFARSAQDPSVALPKPAAASPSAPASGAEPTPLPAPAPNPAAAPSGAVPTPSASASPSQPNIPTAPMMEDGAPEPSAAPGQSLAVVQESAGGKTHPVPVALDAGGGEGRVVRYSVEVEDGLEAHQAEFASVVQGVLHHKMGWQGVDRVKFVPVSDADVARGAAVDIRVVLATPTLTAQLCAPLNTTNPQVSCWAHGRAVLNLQRWVRGAVSYGTDLNNYRVYLVNHEVGHGLGHGHVQCPRAGARAPIMVQQTKGLDGCAAWPWPYTA